MPGGGYSLKTTFKFLTGLVALPLVSTKLRFAWFTYPGTTSRKIASSIVITAEASRLKHKELSVLDVRRCLPNCIRPIRNASYSLSSFTFIKVSDSSIVTWQASSSIIIGGKARFVIG